MQSTFFDDIEIFFENEKEFDVLFEEIFLGGVYEFKTKLDDPKILDLGANIGLSGIYFKKRYPNCELTVVEPVLSNFRLMQMNLSSFNKINSVNGALCPDNFKHETVEIYSDIKNQWHSNASMIKGNLQLTERSPAIKPSDVSFNKFDLIKIDIEGAEDFLFSINDFGDVKEIIIEVHTKLIDIKTLIEHLSSNNFEPQRILKEDDLEVMRFIRTV